MSEDFSKWEVEARQIAIDLALRVVQLGTTSYNVQPTEILRLAARIERYLHTGAINNEQRRIDF